MNGAGWFSTSDLLSLYERLRIPRPANASSTLGRWRKSGHVTSRTDTPPWSLTPTGQHQATELIGGFNYEEIGAELADTPGAEFAHEKHSVIPPSFAPPRWQPGITRLLARFPFENNVFCMTRFPKDDGDVPDPLAALIEQMRKVVSQHGLTLHLASDRQADDDLFGNVGAHMWACQYGIGILEDRGPGKNGLNSNMLIELGSMMIMGRRCKILKDKRAPRAPTDLSGQIYTTVDLDNSTTVLDAVHLWISEDLGLGRCANCPPHPTAESDAIKVDASEVPRAKSLVGKNGQAQQR
jgi:hypothetical protein